MISAFGIEVVANDRFKASSEIFNGAVKTHAIILVKPVSAADVSM